MEHVALADLWNEVTAAHLGDALGHEPSSLSRVAPKPANASAGSAAAFARRGPSLGSTDR
jgi:hypothetical protein